MSTVYTNAVRLYGSDDLRLERFALPALQDGEILVKIVCDSICASTRKASKLGVKHTRIPHDVQDNPIIIGHEFAGEIIQVGDIWKDSFFLGQKVTMQPAIPYKDRLDAPGYSFSYIGGDATYGIIPREIIEMNCLIPFESKEFFCGALAEPFSCVIGAFNASYHVPYGSYRHEMGIRVGGKLAILAGSGPMGQAAIEYIINARKRPALLVVTSTRSENISYLSERFPVDQAAKRGVALHYVLDTDSRGHKTGHSSALAKQLLARSEGDGFDDIMLMNASRVLLETADHILARDGCLNFFAGPADRDFSASINFYNVHYTFTHFVATSGGNIDDIRSALSLMQEGRINPAHIISHVGGLNAVIDTTKRLPEFSGGKKLIYTHKKLELIDLSKLEDMRSDSFYAGLYERLTPSMVWNYDAEAYLLSHAPDITSASSPPIFSGDASHA